MYVETLSDQTPRAESKYQFSKFWKLCIRYLSLYISLTEINNLQTVTDDCTN